MFLDEILMQKNTNSTRHKSKNGECHSELVFNNKHSEIMKELNDAVSKRELDRALYMKNSHGLILESFKFIEEQIIKDLEKKEEIKSSSEGAKTNKNKAQLSLLFKQFPKALEAIVRCSEYGHEKYKETDFDYLNYTRVEGGSKTYADASLRHRMEIGNDFESGLPHQFHSAWNALAELQLWIQENE